VLPELRLNDFLVDAPIHGFSILIPESAAPAWLARLPGANCAQTEEEANP
jgi:hypothetical protein